jgi:hypothetical protein
VIRPPPIVLSGATAAVALATAIAGCGSVKSDASAAGPVFTGTTAAVRPPRTPPRDLENAPPPARTSLAESPPASVPGSSARSGPYRLIEPPLAVWADYPGSTIGDVAVFVRLNRGLPYDSPDFMLDKLALALNSGGYTDFRQGNCYMAALNVGVLPKGYFVGKIVKVQLYIRQRSNHATAKFVGHLSIKVPLRPALAAAPGVAAPVGEPEDQQYFDLLGCGHTM